VRQYQINYMVMSMQDFAAFETRRRLRDICALSPKEAAELLRGAKHFSVGQLANLIVRTGSHILRAVDAAKCAPNVQLAHIRRRKQIAARVLAQQRAREAAVNLVSQFRDRATLGKDASDLDGEVMIREFKVVFTKILDVLEGLA
jgi:hypothetical protein